MAHNGLSQSLGRLAWVRYKINALSNLVARFRAFVVRLRGDWL